MDRLTYAPWGAQNETFPAEPRGSAGPKPLGTVLVLPDERMYRFALNDGTVEVAGNLYQALASVSAHTNIVANTTRAVGAASISATMGATAAAIDIYSEGIAHVNDNAGQGYAYRIRRAIEFGQANALANASAVLTVNLAQGETVQAAITGASTDVSFSRNRFHSVAIHGSPPTARLAGVSPGVAAANRYYWTQVRGEAACLADGTLLEGLHVQASVSTDGAVESEKIRIRTGATGAADVTAFTLATDQDGTETTVALGTIAVSTTADISGPVAIRAPRVGMCIKPNASTDYGLVDLRIE